MGRGEDAAKAGTKPTVINDCYAKANAGCRHKTSSQQGGANPGLHGLAEVEWGVSLMNLRMTSLPLFSGSMTMIDLGI
jgi:hypothetical protein